MAAAVAALSALAPAGVSASEPDGLSVRALALQAAGFRAAAQDDRWDFVLGATDRGLSAGATIEAFNGWNAGLFVTYLGAGRGIEDDSLRLKPLSTVSARLSRSLSRTTRVSFDVFNVFNQRSGDLDYFPAAQVWARPGAAESYLFNPAEPRGFRIRLRKTF